MTRRSKGGRKARSAVAATLAIALSLCATASAQAAGGTYNVLQCHDWTRWGGHGQMSNNGGYLARDLCQQGDARYQLQSTGYGNPGGGARVTFTAPGGTTFAAFSLAFDGRTADGHYAEVSIIQNGGRVVLHRASNQPGGYIGLGPYWNLAASQVVIELTCQNNPPCQPSSTAHAWARNVELYIRDHHDPGFDVGGALIDQSGWLRGSHRLYGLAGDWGSGVARFVGYANGTPIVNGNDSCGGQSPPYSSHYNPCGGAGFDQQLDTRGGQFRNGANQIVFEARDFAGNTTWSGEYTAMIDNARPEAAFPNTQDAEDPELIRAAVADEHSGVAGAKLYLRPIGASDWQALETELKGGEARSRIASAAYEPGEYEFKVAVSDVAGNALETSRREDGTPMTLTLPLRSGVELQAHLDRGASRGQTVPYGTDGAVEGRLLDAGGQPLGDRQITVIEHFGDGALIRARVSEVKTDAEGRWQSKLPAGPTRWVEAAFSGTPRYAPKAKEAGKFNVRSGASFRASDEKVREGTSVRFAGKVRHLGARIPSGGKLVELQVRVKTGRWQTVGEAFRTNEKGRWRRPYRFGKHYTQDALFRFRLKVRREANWPFKRKNTKQRKVLVRAR